MKFLDELAARRRFGMKPGLGTIRALCAALGDPQLRFPAIHVAGTDGKGAVCAMLDAALRAASEERRMTRDELRMKEHAVIGRYTSPHLVRLNERFFLNGAPVGDAVLERAAAPVFDAVSACESSGAHEVTFFEALTAVAFMLYAEAPVDVAVLECGLGGRLDATNVCNSVLSVITRIGLDHCDWLGDTVEKIAAEKAGIIRPGVPVVLGENVPSVRAVVEARARELGAPFFYAPDLASEADIPAGFSLSGAFNRENAVTAIAALRVYLNRSSASSPVDAIVPIASDKEGSFDLDAMETIASTRFVSSSFEDALRGLTRVVWPGRFQRVGDFIVDGAHNPPAAQALVASLASPCQLVAGFCGDKDVDAVLRILKPHVRRAFAVRTNNPRSLSADETAARMRAAGLDAEPCGTLSEALDRARAAGAKSGLPTLVCGSLFLAGEAIVALDAYPWPHAGGVDPSEFLSPSVDAESSPRPDKRDLPSPT